MEKRDRLKGQLGKTPKPFLLSQLLQPSVPSTIEASNFQVSRKTRFIIHGFIDKGEENWVLDMCKVGDRSKPPRPTELARGTQPQHMRLTTRDLCGDSKASLNQPQFPFLLLTHICSPKQGFALGTHPSPLSSFLFRPGSGPPALSFSRRVCISPNEGLWSFVCPNLPTFLKVRGLWL